MERHTPRGQSRRGNVNCSCWTIELLVQQGFTFATGEQIEVTGSRVKFDGSDVLIAREIKQGDKVLTLRNSRGFPRGQEIDGAIELQHGTSCPACANVKKKRRTSARRPQHLHRSSPLNPTQICGQSSRNRGCATSVETPMSLEWTRGSRRTSESSKLEPNLNIRGLL